jgi:hypothetical protein
MRINLADLDWNGNVNRPQTSERKVSYKKDPSRTYSIPVKKKRKSRL